MAKNKLTDIEAFVEARQGLDFWIGMDVHKKSYSVALRTNGNDCRTWVCPADPERFVKTLKEWGIRVEGIAYEAGPTGFELARTLNAAGFAVTVAAPSRIPRPVTAGAKTDRLDCIKLAEYLIRGMLKPIAVPTRSQEAQRGLARCRSQIVNELRRVKQRIKSLLLRTNTLEPDGLATWSREGVAGLDKIDLDPADRLTLDSLLRQLKSLEGERSIVEKHIREIVRSREHGNVMRCLQSVPGVGPTVAAVFQLELFDPKRFTRGEEVTSYLGLAPMVRETGERHSARRLRPVGQKRLRSLLIEAAWIFKAKDPWARQFYNNRLSRTGIAQKAIAALARKLAIILWRLTLEQRPFHPAVQVSG